MKTDWSEYLEILGYSPFLWGKPSTASAPTPFLKAWEELQDKNKNCKNCQLCESRNQLVWGRASLQPRVLFLGEAPGIEENAKGEAFLGEDGALLSKMIGAMGLSPEQVYMSYLVKCTPPERRHPASHEIAACGTILSAEIELMQPDLIVSLGSLATQTLLKTEEALVDLRGKLHRRSAYKKADQNEIPILPTFHPAYLLREPSMKRASWDDLKVAMNYLGVGK